MEADSASECSSEEEGFLEMTGLSGTDFADVGTDSDCEPEVVAARPFNPQLPGLRTAGATNAAHGVLNCSKDAPEPFKNRVTGARSGMPDRSNGSKEIKDQAQLQQEREAASAASAAAAAAEAAASANSGECYDEPYEYAFDRCTGRFESMLTADRMEVLAREGYVVIDGFLGRGGHETEADTNSTVTAPVSDAVPGSRPESAAAAADGGGGGVGGGGGGGVGGGVGGGSAAADGVQQNIRLEKGTGSAPRDEGQETSAGVDGEAEDDELRRGAWGAALRQEIMWLYRHGHMPPNATRFSSGGGGAGGPQEPLYVAKGGVFEVDLTADRVRDRVPELGELYWAAHEIAQGLERHLGVRPVLLDKTFGCASMKVMCGDGSGGSFPWHYDNPGDGNTRKITCLLYLNPGWAPADGGELMLQPFLGRTVIVPPIHDRMVLFYSESMLHAVAPSRAPRAALTIWLHGKGSFSNAPTALALDSAAHAPTPPPFIAPTSTGNNDGDNEFDTATLLSLLTGLQSDPEACKRVPQMLRHSTLQRPLARAVYASEFEKSIRMCACGGQRQVRQPESSTALRASVSQGPALGKHSSAQIMCAQGVVATFASEPWVVSELVRMHRERVEQLHGSGGGRLGELLQRLQSLKWRGRPLRVLVPNSCGIAQRPTPIVSDDEWCEADAEAETEITDGVRPGSQPRLPPRDSSSVPTDAWTDDMPFGALCTGELLENGGDDADDDIGDTAGGVCCDSRPGAVGLRRRLEEWGFAAWDGASRALNEAGTAADGKRGSMTGSFADTVRDEIEQLHARRMLQPSFNRLASKRDAVTGAVVEGEVVAKPHVFELDLLVGGKVVTDGEGSGRSGREDSNNGGATGSCDSAAARALAMCPAIARFTTGGLGDRLAAELNTAYPALGLRGLDTVKVQLNEGGGGCFPAHYDTSSSFSDRSITCLLYLNPSWTPGDGGELRILPFPLATADVRPRHDRLALFCSTATLHRVMPATARRLCLSIWFRSADSATLWFPRVLPPRPADIDSPVLQKLWAMLAHEPSRRVLTKVFHRQEYARSFADAFVGCTGLEAALSLDAMETDKAVALLEPQLLDAMRNALPLLPPWRR